MSDRQPNGGDDDRDNVVEDGRIDAPQTSVTRGKHGTDELMSIERPAEPRGLEQSREDPAAR